MSSKRKLPSFSVWRMNRRSSPRSEKDDTRPCGKIEALEVETHNAGPYAETMNVHLTDDQKAFIRQAIKTGRFQSEEDAVEEALALCENLGTHP